jgi:alkylation response protein AidB-like acyl-CoA dehydrogenase
MSELHDPAVLAVLRGLFDDAADADASASLAAFGVWDLAHADRIRNVQHVFHEQGRAGTPSDTFNTLQQSVLDDHFPGVQATMALTTAARLDDPVVRIENCAATGVVYAFGNPARLAVYGAAPSTTQVAVVETDNRGVSVEPTPATDKAHFLTRITLRNTPVDAVALDDSARLWWTDAVAWGRLALAWELIGGATVALKAATAYAETRIQFGRPIGTFQAVQHRLAETLVAIEAAEAVVELPKESVNPLVATMAKALAGQAYAVTAKNCLQVFGAIGFTADHPFDGYLRRGGCLDRMLGSSAALTNEVGHRLLRLKSVPSLCALQTSR